MQEERRLPKFDYYLDESDPDVALLRRQDGSFVGAFSARGATRKGIRRAAEEDYRAMLEAYAASRRWSTREQSSSQLRDSSPSQNTFFTLTRVHRGQVEEGTEG